METEAYAAVDDEASHTFVRPSAREFVARHEAGTAYVYFSYGAHWMLNVLVKGSMKRLVRSSRRQAAVRGRLATVHGGIV